MDAMNTDWPSNVFDGLFTQIVEVKTKFILDLIVYYTRNHDAAGLSQRFQPRCYVDAIAKNVTTINDDVTDIDTNTELDAFLSGDIGIALNHAALDVDGAAHCVDYTSMLDKHAIARGLDNTTAVFGDLRINEFFAVAWRSVPSSSMPINRL